MTVVKHPAGECGVKDQVSHAYNHLRRKECAKTTETRRKKRTLWVEFGKSVRFHTYSVAKRALFEWVGSGALGQLARSTKANL